MRPKCDTFGLSTSYNRAIHRRISDHLFISLIWQNIMRTSGLIWLEPHVLFNFSEKNWQNRAVSIAIYFNVYRHNRNFLEDLTCRNKIYKRCATHSSYENRFLYMVVGRAKTAKFRKEVNFFVSCSLARAAVSSIIRPYGCTLGKRVYNLIYNPHRSARIDYYF